MQGSFCEANMDEECKKIGRKCFEDRSKRSFRSVSREVATSAECKTKTDVKENFNKVKSGSDQLIVIQTDSTKIVVSYKSDFKVYRLWNMTAILYLPT